MLGRLTLFVVPCAYVALHGLGDRARAWVLGARRRGDPELERDLPGAAGD